MYTYIYIYIYIYMYISIYIYMYISIYKLKSLCHNLTNKIVDFQQIYTLLLYTAHHKKSP